MKRFVLLLFIASFFELAFFQDKNTVYFNIYIKPNCIYTQVTKTSSHSEISYKGSQPYLDELKKKGIPNPTIKNKSEASTLLMNTGNVPAKGHQFVVSVQTDNPFLDSIPSVGQNKVDIYGLCNLKSMPVLDSISSKADLTSNAKEMLLFSLDASIKRISLPEHTLKVNDTFTKTDVIKVPIGSNVMEIELTTTCTLVSVLKDVAYFTTSEVYAAKTNPKKDKTALLGTGRGKFSYSSRNNYYLSYQTTDTLFMHVNYDKNLDLDIKSINGYSMTTSITKITKH